MMMDYGMLCSVDITGVMQRVGKIVCLGVITSVG